MKGCVIMKKRILSLLLAVMLMCSLSLVASAYSLSGNASVTGNTSLLKFSGRASTNCPLSALSSSDGEFDIYQDGRNIYYSQQHDKTSFSDTWQIKNPEHVLYECAMTGNFFYINLPADKQTWTGSKDLRLVRSGVTGDEAIIAIDNGFKEALSQSFGLDEDTYYFVQRYSEAFSSLNLEDTDAYIDRNIGDTKPVYLFSKDGGTLLVLKQDSEGMNYKYSFSISDGQYTFENVEQNQGELIDGGDFLTT